jgi:folate-binding Fe-S cluster repair protein YgfZ
MAVTDTLAAEDRALREACGLVDRSERGKLALTGPAAKEFLHGQVTQDIESLTPGTGAYAAFLTHKGKMLGDLRVLDTGAELLLDTERAALQELFNMIRRFKLGMDVELHKRTLETGLLSLIGPAPRWRPRARRRSARTPRRSCASSPAAPAGAASSTTPSSRRRPGSTTAPSRSPRAATSARRPWPACIGAASPTATCAACASPRRS